MTIATPDSGGTRAAKVEDVATQVALARAIATVAHRSQKDKVGAAYISHPARVASRFDPILQPLEHCVAWLHDVIEDTGTTAADLRSAGIQAGIVDAVVLLTRSEEVASEDYYCRIAAHPSARAVKLADIDDNADPERTRLLDDETRTRLARKYADARQLLAPAGGDPA